MSAEEIKNELSALEADQEKSIEEVTSLIISLRYFMFLGATTCCFWAFLAQLQNVKRSIQIIP